MVEGIKFIWDKGFPEKRGMYLVQLDDGELCVTYWNDGKASDTWGDKVDRGWTILRNSNARVIRWVKTEFLI